MLISDEYRRLNAELHEKWGPKTRNKRLDRIINIVKHQIVDGMKSVLDYGCGVPGHLRLELGDIVRNYDPAVPEIAGMPEPADLVVCTGAIEHVEPEFLENVLDHIKELALRRVMIAVPSAKSRQWLSDGRNAHLICKPRGWWAPKFEQRWDCLGTSTMGVGGTAEFVFIGARRSC